MTRARMLLVLRALFGLPPETRRITLSTFPKSMVVALAEEWWWRAHGGQQEPEEAPNGEPWRVWAILAGRGFGKTRAGAEWVFQRARENPDARIALVAASLDEVARVMVEGDSGLLAIARSGEQPRWLSSRGLFLFPSGAQAFAYTAERPSKLRGPQHHFAWCDELAKWPRADSTWDNLMLGLRLGEMPRTMVTTTPAPIPLLRRIRALPRAVVTQGRTDENPHSAADFRHAVREMYAGTRLGRQELDGILFEDVPGALWTRDILEKARVDRILPVREADGEGNHAQHGGGASAPPAASFKRIVVGVDPPAGADGDACGIVVCGMDRADVAWVLADLTVSGLRPEAWARRVAAAAEQWEASKVVAEQNQGGLMVESVLRAAASDLPVRLVSATRSKPARAEPVALRFETGEARLAGCFPELEDELCAITYAGYEGQSRSPDRADAMVWAMTELFRPQRPQPRVSLL